MHDPHSAVLCPRGHGPMDPASTVAGATVRRFECHAPGCRNAGQVPARLLAGARRRPALVPA